MTKKEMMELLAKLTPDTKEYYKLEYYIGQACATYDIEEE